MGVKFKTVKNDLPRLEKEYSSLNGKKVQVGVLGGGENAWLAGIHEYGCNIPVTDKMRGWLGAHGLHLKKTTVEIHIPERSFLRTGYDTHKDEVLKQVDKLLIELCSGVTAELLCETIGQLLSSKIKDYIEELDQPANHPFTIGRKGSANPLVDTGDLVGAVSYKVV